MTAGPGLDSELVVVGEPRQISSKATTAPTTATANSERTNNRAGEGGAACVPRLRAG
jgi:hypothetical protein